MTNSVTELSSPFGKLLWRSKSRGNRQISEDTQVTPRQMSTTCLISFNKPHSANPINGRRVSQHFKRNMISCQNKVAKGSVIDKRGSYVNPLDLHSLLQVKPKDTFTYMSSFYPNKCSQKKRIFFKARLSNSTSIVQYQNKIQFIHSPLLLGSKKLTHKCTTKNSITSQIKVNSNNAESRFSLHMAKTYEFQKHPVHSKIIKHLLLSSAIKTMNHTKQQRAFSISHSPLVRNKQSKYRYSFEDWKQHKDWVQNHKGD